MAKTTAARNAEKELDALAQSMGLELVDVALAKEQDGMYLRICIDKPGGVSLTDCEAFHKKSIPLVESINYDYMECESPGIDRPFKKEKDYLRHMGGDVEIRLYKPIDSKSRQKAYSGRLVGCENGFVTIESAGEMITFSEKDIARAAPLIDWAKELEKAGGLDKGRNNAQ